MTLFQTVFPPCLMLAGIRKTFVLTALSIFNFYISTKKKCQNCRFSSLFTFQTLNKMFEYNVLLLFSKFSLFIFSIVLVIKNH